MLIAALITCHNRVEKTIQCLELLARASGGFHELEVFLVDDGSTDGTGDAVREFANQANATDERRGKIHLIHGDGTLYWAKGMALAWQEAVKRIGKSVDFYLWLNDDVQLKLEAISQVIKDWRKCSDNRSVIVGACSTDATENHSSYSATTVKDVQIFPNGETPQVANGWFNGNFVLVPRRTYEEVGMISADYTHARADYDYAERLKKAKIPFYCSSHFVGVCEPKTKWGMEGKGRIARFRELFRSGYFNLHDLWIYRYRHYGIVRAILSCGHLIWNVI